MERVLSLEQYSSLIKTARKQHPANQTNCYLLPGAVNKYIEAKKLYFESLGGGISFIIEEETCFQLYYFVGLREDIQIIRKNKPVILDIIYDINRITPDNLFQIERKWLDCGFVYYKKYRHLTLSMTQERLDAIPECLSDSKYVMSHAGLNDTDAVLSLWKLSLDAYSTALPSTAELNTLIERGLVLCAKTKDNGKLSAVMKLEPQGRNLVVHHVVVDKDHRQQGLGKRLFDYCYKDTGTHGMQYYSWVDVNNTPSLQLHLSKGWTFNGRLTSQLLLDSK